MTAITNESFAAMERAASTWSAANSTGNIVFLRSALQGWQLRAIEKIASLRRLPENWDSYGATPISEETLDAAEELIALPALPSVATPRVLPLADGSVQIGWQNGDREADIEVNRDSRFSVLLTERDQTILDQQSVAIDHATLQRILKWIEGQ